jgi:acyl-CoA synthetase (AMP-forming)/AMP-acid ligase II
VNRQDAATIPALVRKWARERGSNPFCTFYAASGETEEVSFAQLYGRSAAYARQYKALGIARGDLIIIILAHSPHLFYSYLGAMLAGAVPSFMAFPTVKQPLDVYWEDHVALFERIRPQLVVTYEANVEAALAALERVAVPLLVARESILDAPPGLPEPDVVDAQLDDVACLQHSSGTTGAKKGVMLTHRAILDEVAAYAEVLKFGDGDRIASWLPLYHDMGFIACFMSSVVRGTHLIELDPFEWVARPAILLDAIETFKATLCWLPNFAFSHIANLAPRNRTWDLSSVRAFINCSEPCKADTMGRFVDRFADAGITSDKVHVCYAMAENVFGVSQTELSHPPARMRLERDAFDRGVVATAHDPSVPVIDIVSCGRPLPGVEVAVRSPDGSEPAAAAIGELAVRSPFLFPGYYRMPEKTAQVLRDGWYSTGDLGFLAGGEVYVTGRVDDMMIVHGRNYYAHEIEATVNTVSGVAPGRCVAIGVDDARSDALAVVVLLEREPDADERMLKRNVKEQVFERTGLGLHSVHIVAAGQLLKTTSGKISRKKNKELYLQFAATTVSA